MMRPLPATFRYLALGLLAFGLGIAPAQAQALDKGLGAACGRKVAAEGAPAAIWSIANMNAIQLWIELAREQEGEANAMWHNADGALVKCEQIKHSALFRCYATGKPCPPSAGAANKLN